MNLTLLFIATTFHAALSACPNRCSGHGVCGLADTCQCQPRWVGPDCAQRQCPYGLSWVASGETGSTVSGGLQGSDSRQYHGITMMDAQNDNDTVNGEGVTKVYLQTLETRDPLGDNNDELLTPGDSNENDDFYNGMNLNFLGDGLSLKIVKYAAASKGGKLVEAEAWVQPRLESPSTVLPAGSAYFIQTTHNNVDIGHHAYTECSSKGKCDRDSGECQCFAGYTGRGCRRQSCPNDCSGHGRCKTNAEVNSDYSPHGEDQEVNEFHSQYWDYNKTRQCVCDRGFEGYDCSLRICPRGSDPLSDCGNADGVGEALSDIQTLTFAQTGHGKSGYFTLDFEGPYGDVFTTKPILLEVGDECKTSSCRYYTGDNDQSIFDNTAKNIEAALKELPNFAIPSVTVTKSSLADKAEGFNVYNVTFNDPANSGRQNLLKCSTTSHEENLHNHPDVQPRYIDAALRYHVDNQVICTATSETDAIYNFNALNKKKYKQSAVCSNRGACDSGTGICACYDGFTGEACGTQTVFF